jgi:uncharacterized protein (DUF697 family)
MSTRLDQANAIVKKYMNWSFVGGLIPVPLLDTAAVSGVQMKMLYDLAALYEVPFKAHAAQSVVASLLGAVVPGMVTAGAIGTGLKFLPVIGTTLGIITMPALSLAATYAVGRVFMTHFESGGTLLDFDPEKMREHFRAEFDAASSGRQAKA